MTNRLKSVHRTIFTCHFFLDHLENFENAKNKKKSSCHLPLAKEYNIFCDHAPYTLRGEYSKTEKCNILYKFRIQSNL